MAATSTAVSIPQRFAEPPMNMLWRDNNLSLKPRHAHSKADSKFPRLSSPVSDRKAQRSEAVERSPP
jgi:hypothetical protein